MRTDLKINYTSLEELSDRIADYYTLIDEVEIELENLKEVLEEQKSEAVYELLEDISTFTCTSADKKEALKKLRSLLDDYIADMKSLIHPIVSSENVRADQYDVWYNIGQIEKPIDDLTRYAKIECQASYYTAPAMETPEEKLEREKKENNYTKVENFRRFKLVHLANKLNKNLKKIWKIYDNNVKKFEETDDEYRKEIDKLYSSYTNTGDKVLDSLVVVGDVTWEFIKALGGVLLFVVVFALVPELGIALIVLPIVGCITLACVPKQYVPKWLHDKKDQSDAIINIVKGGPKSIVEAIGQGLMDTVQTPEGVAAVSGTVVGIAISGKVVKKYDPQIKAAKGKYNTWKQKVKGKVTKKIKDIKDGKYTDEEIKRIINNLKGDGFKNNPLRQAYENEVASLKEYGEKLLASGMSEKEVAQILYQARRDLGVKYKDMTPQPLRDYIYELNKNRYEGDKLGPTYEYLKKKGKSDRQIIDSASKPNDNIDALLSKFEEWLRGQ